MKRHRWKDFLAIISIIFLLPYVVTVFMFGFPEKEEDSFPTAGKTIQIEDNGMTEEIDRERYIAGVLAAQMPITYEKEALKAQSVIARTFFVKHEMEGSVVKKEEAVQEYMTISEMEKLWGSKEFSNNYNKLLNAVKETANEIMIYEGLPIEPSFHAVSAGMTRSGEEVLGSDTYPYLKSKADEKALHAPNFVTIIQMKREEVERIIRESYGEEAANLIGESLLASFEILERDGADYVTRIKVVGQTIGGEQFRKQFGLPSASFQLEELEGKLRIVCKGLGHGLGMSLYGANELAKEGKNYREILQYYFENIEVSSE